ncbi:MULTISPECIES: rhodanese-like domain-containing protein [Enterococcus]|uniref:Rhodanese-like domain-containing protein n=1 Tax=Enterococcus alishanensis TaxID=1303817 RepID=A0ABS6T946_9ENTE|nr:rhodanese-like domain-containing protein [Enterococcus alishanensis]MBV7389416.1 rhodanese-like domain-containing protein [Enterococcus alishanensis]
MLHTITTQEFKTLVDTANVAVIDLRDPDLLEPEALNEFNNSLQISFTELPSRINELDKEKTYYLISQFGGRTKPIAQYLSEKGFDVVNVIGGVNAYHQAVLV